MVAVRTEKFEELIVYIASRSEADERFTLARLRKMLFSADFERYAHSRTSITGMEYLRLEDGPVPEGYASTLAALQWRDAIAIETHAIDGHDARRVVPRRAPKTDVFTTAELRVVDGVIERNRGETAGTINHASHEFIGWQAVEPGERIPYSMAWLYKPALTEEQIARVAEEVHYVRRD